MFDHIAANELLHSIVPISRFNKGEANRIFEEVSASGFKIVVKNNKPACVLLAPERYEELMETLENYFLFSEAENRLKRAGSETIPHEEILRDLGVEREELDSIDVEIEP